MVLEMKRALEDLKKGADGAYRKIYDATYEEVYCKSLLITQEEKQALSLVEDFYAGVLKEIGEALKAEDQNLWFWQQYYKKIRREYQKLLSVQHKEAPGKAQNLAQILAALPLLHRVMLVMAYEDDFSAEQISAVLGLASEKIEGELEKLEKILPTLTQGQPQENAVWLAGWKTILAGADRQILGAVAADWVDVAYEKASAAAGVKEQPKKEDNFEYFVADVDLTEEKPKKKKVEPVIEEEDDEDEEEYSDEDDEDEEYDDDDEEYDDEDDDEDDEDDEDRYDWDLEDDGRKMIIIGAVVAVILCVVIGLGAMWFMGRNKSDSATSSQTEEQQEDEDAAADLVIKGDGDTADDTEPAEEADAEETEETEETAPEEEAEPEEPQTVTMKVNASSLNVRSEANTTSSVVTSLTNGDTVEVLGDASQEWVQIRCTSKNNEEGYVKSEYLVAAE